MRALWLPQSIHSIAVRGLADAPDMALGKAFIDDCMTKSMEAIEAGMGTPRASEMYEETGMRTEPIGVAGMGYIKVERIERPRLAYRYELTAEGKKIAQKLKEIEAILK